MRVDGGANCHEFWDKRLFCVFFVRPTYFHVAGGSTLPASGVILVPVMLPGYPKLHSLATSYWTPTYRTKNLSLSALKLYISFHGVYNEALSSCTFATPKAKLLLSRQRENNLDYINLQVVKKGKKNLQVHTEFFNQPY